MGDDGMGKVRKEDLDFEGEWRKLRMLADGVVGR